MAIESTRIEPPPVAQDADAARVAIENVLGQEKGNLKREIASAMERLAAFPRTPDIDKLLQQLGGLHAELDSPAALFVLGQIRMELTNLQPQITSEVAEAQAKQTEEVMEGLYIAAFVEDNRITNLDGFAEANGYDADLLHNYRRLFGDAAGLDPKMQSMVGVMGQHATQEEREAMAHVKTREEMGIHMGRIAGRMKLSELAQYEAQIGKFRESIAAESPDAAHFLSIMERQAHDYNEAIKKGQKPVNDYVLVPPELQELQHANIKDPNQLKAQFLTQYQKYEERRSAELENASRNLPPEELENLRNYARDAGLNLNDPHLLFRIKQRMDMDHAKLPTAEQVYAKQEHGESLTQTERAVLSMAVTNDMYGNYGTASLFRDVVKTLETQVPDPAERDRRFYTQSTDEKMQFIEASLNGGKLPASEKAALRVYLERLKTPADYGTFVQKMTEAESARDPKIMTDFLARQADPDYGKDDRAPAVVKAIDQTVAYQGTLDMRFGTDNARFTAQAVAASAKEDAYATLQALRARAADTASATAADSSTKLDRFGPVDATTYAIYQSGREQRALAEKATDLAQKAALQQQANQLFALAQEMDKQSTRLPDVIQQAARENADGHPTTEDVARIRTQLTEKVIHDYTARAEAIVDPTKAEKQSEKIAKVTASSSEKEKPASLADAKLDLPNLGNLGVTGGEPIPGAPHEVPQAQVASVKAPGSANVVPT